MFISIADKKAEKQLHAATSSERPIRSLTEVVTKMVLYYPHERIWSRITLGRTGNAEQKKQKEYTASTQASQPAYSHAEN